jgi:hypothetical protein
MDPESDKEAWSVKELCSQKIREKGLYRKGDDKKGYTAKAGQKEGHSGKKGKISFDPPQAERMTIPFLSFLFS